MLIFTPVPPLFSSSVCLFCFFLFVSLHRRLCLFVFMSLFYGQFVLLNSVPTIFHRMTVKICIVHLLCMLSREAKLRQSCASVSCFVDFFQAGNVEAQQSLFFLRKKLIENGPLASLCAAAFACFLVNFYLA